MCVYREYVMPKFCLFTEKMLLNGCAKVVIDRQMKLLYLEGFTFGNADRNVRDLGKLAFR